MITRLTTWLYAALLLVLEEVDELRNRRFFHTESVQTRMPRGVHSRNTSYLRFDLDQPVLQLIETRAHCR